MSVKRASELYDINHSTLINHLQNWKCGPVGRPTILTQEEEQHIDRFQLKILVQDYLKRIDRPNPFSDGIPGKDGITGFEKRWREILRRRVGQNPPKNRAEACSKVVLQDFYNKLNNSIERFQLQRKLQNIFNCDENGQQTDYGIQKILCRKGSVNRHKVVGSTTAKPN
ncbi:hypothetical protein QE152_g40060 [Popillia japonica]|uniref:HTH psq-type domain-containing protein n=1 Tax=Popillia japonica TaxID=7064 RepID=A0AAW1HT06_POPJA